MPKNPWSGQATGRSWTPRKSGLRSASAVLKSRPALAAAGIGVVGAAAFAASRWKGRKKKDRPIGHK